MMKLHVNESFVQKSHEEINARALESDGDEKFLRMCKRYVNGHWKRFIPKLEIFSGSMEGSVFVDYGSKFGHLTPLLVDQGVERIIAVDVLDEYLIQGKRFFGDKFPIEYIRSHECYVDIPSSSADFVLANEVISHINPAFLDTFYAEIARILKPNGQIAISDGNNWTHLNTRLDLLDWYALWDGGASKEFGEKNYRQMRKDMIAESYPNLDDSDLDYLAINTSGLHGSHLLQQAGRYVSGELFIERPYRPGVYPTHPRHGVVMERAFDPRQVIIALETYGIKATQLMKGQPLLDDSRRGITKNFTIRGVKMPESIEALSEHARKTLAIPKKSPHTRLMKNLKRLVRR